LAFVVETGEGLEDATSYASFAAYVSHFTDRGSPPAELQAAIEEALIRATDFVDLRYQFVGSKLTELQALQWPRAYAYRARPAFDAHCVPVEGVPLEVERATIELAKRALAGELAPDPVVSTTGQTVVADRKKVGPIEVETSFVGSGPSAWVKRFPAVDKLLRDLVVSEGGRVYRQ
jgi:hypothetical protein